MWGSKRERNVKFFFSFGESLCSPTLWVFCSRGHDTNFHSRFWFLCGQGQEQVRAAMAHVQKELPRVVSCAEMPNCGEVRSSWASSLPEESFLSTFRGKFSTVMMDSWALVMSDIFLGRKKSSMTHNVHLWRSIGVEGHPREIHHLFYDLFP